MNIPIKVIKSNSIPSEKVRNQQKMAQKYFNSFNNCKSKGNVNNKNLNENSNNQNQVKNINNLFSSNNLKEEIIRWFFSFDSNSKLIICSIENKWLVNCLHYMYIKIKSEPNTRFSYLDGDAPECGIENYHHKQTKSPMIFTHKKINNNINLFYHFFSTIEDSKKSNFSGFNTYNGYGNLTSNQNYFENPEYNLLDFINFYKCEESDISNDYCSYMTLSKSCVESEIFFLKLFDHYSSNKAFTSFIPSSLDAQSKYYTFGMPEWFKKKEPYSLQEICMAYFEQVIIIKFVLFHLEPSNYNFYYSKYIKNSYIKELKEENDPAIYNEFSSNNNNHAYNKSENLRNNSFNNFSIGNFQLNGEYGYNYNYNTILDSPSQESLLNYSNNNELLGQNNFLYVYEVNQPGNYSAKDDFEKNINANYNKQQNCSFTNNTSVKNYSFIKSLHNVRINLEKERNYPRGILDIPEFDCHLKKLFKEIIEIIAFYNNDIGSMEVLYNRSNADKLKLEIKSNKECEEFLKNKSFNPQKFVSFNRHSKLLNKVSLLDEKENIELRVDVHFFIIKHKNIEELLNDIFFLNIYQIFTFDDIFLKRLYDNIYSIYTYKNVLELLEHDDKISKNTEKQVNNNANNNCKKKKKKKNTKKSTNSDKDENNIKVNNSPTKTIAISNAIDQSSLTNNKNNIDNKGQAAENNKLNTHKNSINNIDQIEEIKLYYNNDNNLKEDFLNINGHTNDKTLYNNFLNINYDVDNSNDNLSTCNISNKNLDKKKIFSNDFCHNNYINIIAETYCNTNAKAYQTKNNQTASDSDKENLEKNKRDNKTDETKESINDVPKINNNERGQDNSKKINNISNNKKLKSKRQSYHNPKIDNVKKNKEVINEKQAILISDLNKSILKGDYINNNKRSNSNSEIKKNSTEIILEEEKKEHRENSKIEKIINYKEMNLKDLLYLVPENKPSKVKEGNLNNINIKKIHNTKLLKSENILVTATNNKKVSNEEMLETALKIQFKENISEKSKETEVFKDILKSIIDKIVIDEKETPNRDKILYSNHKRYHNNNYKPKDIQNIETLLFDDLNAFEAGNLSKAQSSKNAGFESKTSLENKNLNLIKDNIYQGIVNHHITIPENIRNYNDSDSYKNVMNQEKTENDTDTAYSSSNQSETNNYNQDNTDFSCYNDSLTNLNDINKYGINNINKNNLMFLKNNLKNKPDNLNINKEVQITDLNNINNYLISPKKVSEDTKKVNYEINDATKKHLKLDLIDLDFKLQGGGNNSNCLIKNQNTNYSKKANKFEDQNINKNNLTYNPLTIISQDTNNGNKKNLAGNKKYEDGKDILHSRYSFNDNNNYLYQLKNPQNDNDFYPKNLNYKKKNNNNNSYNNLNSPNSVKSEKISFSNKSQDMLFNSGHTTNNSNHNLSNFEPSNYFSQNQNYDHKFSHKIINQNNFNKKNNYFACNSPNNSKVHENNNLLNLKFEKNNKIHNNNININSNNNIHSSISNNNSHGSSSISSNQTTSTCPESQKFKPKNKPKKNSGNINISKDDLNILKSKEFNFMEKTQTQNDTTKKNCKLNTNTHSIIPQLQPSSSSHVVPNTINTVPQSTVYQSYIPKNVNFRNFSFPIDFNSNFQLNFNPTFNNFNYYYQMNLNNMGYLNFNSFNLTNNNYFDSNFYRKLHNDIVEYDQKLQKNLALTKDIKVEVIKYLTEKIKDILNFLNIEINIYGSFANELSIESSDIDLVVKYENINTTSNGYSSQENYFDIEYLIGYLTSSFNDLTCMEKVNPIYTASVPIIKLVIK